MSWTGPKGTPGPQGWQSPMYDPQLVEAIKDELRLKLTLDIDEICKGTITISLQRSNQYVEIIFDNDVMVLKNTKLPDGNFIKAQYLNLSDPDLDPIKTICRYVDKALRLVANYENKVIHSKFMLEQLL